MAKVGDGIQTGLSWIPDSNGHVPGNGIVVGSGVYIARMHESGGLIPGKVVPQYKKAYCSNDEREYEHQKYEVLCDTSAPGTSKCYRWLAASDGNVPDNAVVGGVSKDGDALYVARSEIFGVPVAGKVDDDHTSASFPYGGKEHAVKHYDVLVWCMK
ncbi:unnamed protein product [Calicophoron daubneyi]|uniref:DM9 domain-containing protein n=1 Tax=Calicophoron daubneyi TaxID=300641 RepID=A0AAV2TG10_CALDB